VHEGQVVPQFATVLDVWCTWDIGIITQSIVMSVCVCVCVFVCPQSYLRYCTFNLYQFFERVTCGHGSVLLWQRNNTLYTSSFMDDVIFAYKPKLLDVATQLKRSAHAALGLAINCAQ